MVLIADWAEDGPTRSLFLLKHQFESKYFMSLLVNVKFCLP